MSIKACVLRAQHGSFTCALSAWDQPVLSDIAPQMQQGTYCTQQLLAVTPTPQDLNEQ
jgi:hypothetical protein